MDVSLSDKGLIVESLWQAVDGAVNDLAVVPDLVRRVIETDAWRERTQRGKTYRNDRFLDFITTTPPAGCGWPPEKVEALLKDDAEALALWRDATTGKRGKRAKGDNNDNVIINAAQGNSRAYTLARLKRERPDLFARIIAKDLSANAAAIEAGWRKAPSALERLRKAWAKATPEEQRVFLDGLRPRRVG